MNQNQINPINTLLIEKKKNLFLSSVPFGDKIHSMIIIYIIILNFVESIIGN